MPANNRWAKSNPEAADRLAKVRAALAAISEEVAVPVENLLPTDAVRQLCWDGTADGAGAVDEALAASGARNWQRALTVTAVAAALASA